MDGKNVLYVIVHERCISLDIDMIRRGEVEGNLEKCESVYREIKRIKNEEKFETVSEPWRADYLDRNSENTLIRICGAYRERCIKRHFEVLRKNSKGKKLEIEIYDRATLSFPDFLP